MTVDWDGVIKWSVVSLLAVVSAVVSFLGRLVWKNREASIELKGRVDTLEEKMEDCEDSQLTKEDVRDVLDDAFEKRDKVNKERREEWNTRFALEVKQAVSDGIKECRHCHPVPSGSGEVAPLP